MTQGIITLVAKPTKDEECLDNWCQITFNKDYKILALIVAELKIL